MKSLSRRVTFIAPINAVRYVGADPVFMDCDPYYNIDVEKTRDFLSTHAFLKKGLAFHRATGKKIARPCDCRFILFGNAVDIEPLVDLLSGVEYPLYIGGTPRKVWEHSIVAGTVAGKAAGTSDVIGCLSFNGK